MRVNSIAHAINDTLAPFLPRMRANKHEFDPKHLNLGTVVAALTYNEGVIIGSDWQVTCGTKRYALVEKIARISPHSALGIAGTVSDAMFTIDVFRAVLQRIKQELSVKKIPSITQVKVLQELVLRLRFEIQEGGIDAHFLFAGFDETRNVPWIMEIFGEGSGIEHPDCGAIGSGGDDALPILKPYTRKTTRNERIFESALATMFSALKAAGVEDIGCSDVEKRAPLLIVIDKNGSRTLAPLCLTEQTPSVGGGS